MWCEEQEATAAHAASRGEESLPIEMVDRLLAGETPLWVWRDHRGLRLQDLAGQTGISVSYLSELESGKKEGRVQHWRAIARALDVDLESLLLP